MVRCHICDKNISKQSNLNKHLRNIHNFEVKPLPYDKSVWNYKCLELNCNISYPQNSSLIKHLKEVHNMHFEDVEEINFKNESEFEYWKTAFEIKHKCNYIVARRWSSPNGEVTYYYCNRTKGGNQCYISDEQRRRRLKSQGRCKLDFACTSQIRLMNDGNKIAVQVQKTHYGHSLDLQHLRIPKEERVLLASKLISGATKTEIIDSIHNKIDDSFKRTDLLTPKDLDNIKRSYKIYNYIKDGKRKWPDCDITYIDHWVQECQAMPPAENPVLFYKKVEETSSLDDLDFCVAVMNKFQERMLQKFGKNVVLIDMTQHELDNYSLELTTVSVIDEFDELFPVAFMFCNAEDFEVYNSFFRSIQQRAGTINARTFMSDITNSVYNAWVQVMGPVSYRLFNSWHVDMDWQLNLLKIPVEEKRTEIYLILKGLQEEASESEFRNNLISQLNMLLTDDDTKHFGHYFLTGYMDNYKKWAYCFRKCAGLNANIKLEPIYETIKFKKQVNGLDTVLKYVRDKSVGRVLKLVKGKNIVTYHEEVLKRHESAVTGDLGIEERDDTSWEVSKNSEKYTVEKLLDASCCCLICPVCKICLHEFSCTCSDFIYECKICEHIHRTVMFKDLSTVLRNDLSSASKEVVDPLLGIKSELPETSANNSFDVNSLVTNVVCKIEPEVKYTNENYPIEDENRAEESYDDSVFEGEGELIQFEIIESDSEEDVQNQSVEKPTSSNLRDKINETFVKLTKSRLSKLNDSDVKNRSVERPTSINLRDKINETFVKLTKSQLSKLNNSNVMKEISLHLHALNSLIDVPGSSGGSSRGSAGQEQVFLPQKKRKSKSSGDVVIKKEKKCDGVL